jgi:hypothetical protein
MNEYENTNNAANTARKLESERVDKEIAQDVARGESIRANVASVQANAYARDYASKAREVEYARSERDAAFVNSVIAADRARRASLNFWTLIGFFLIAIGVGGFWYMSKPQAQPVPYTTTVASKEMPAVRPQATPVPQAAPTRFIVPVPVVVPSSPRVIEHRVYVPVPVPAPTNDVPQRNMPVESASPADTPAPASPDDNASTTDNGSDSGNGQGNQGNDSGS